MDSKEVYIIEPEEEVKQADKTIIYADTNPPVFFKKVCDVF